jgi:uncharacterized integral membrane protein
MSKKMIWGLVLIAALVVVLVISRGSAEVNLVFYKLKAACSLVYLGFAALGVVIGILLK